MDNIAKEGVDYCYTRGDGGSGGGLSHAMHGRGDRGAECVWSRILSMKLRRTDRGASGAETP